MADVWEAEYGYESEPHAVVGHGVRLTLSDWDEALALAARLRELDVVVAPAAEVRARPDVSRGTQVDRG